MSNQVNKQQIQQVTYGKHKVPVTKVIDNEKTVQDYFWVEAESARIIFSGNATIVILEDGSKGVAQCHENDQFNPRIGVKIAYNRAKIISLQKEVNLIRRNL